MNQTSQARLGSLRVEFGELDDAAHRKLIQGLRIDRRVRKVRPDAAGARRERREKIVRWFTALPWEWQQRMLEEVDGKL